MTKTEEIDGIRPIVTMLGLAGMLIGVVSGILQSFITVLSSVISEVQREHNQPVMYMSISLIVILGECVAELEEVYGKIQNITIQLVRSYMQHGSH